MGEEKFLDTLYALDINSFLFALAVDYIDKDTFEFGIDELENKRIQFINCGRPCIYCFPGWQLKYLLKKYEPFIKPTINDRWIVNLKMIFGNFLNKFTDEQLKLCSYEPIYAKTIYLYKWFGIDERIFDPYKCVAGLLKCSWMFDKKRESKRQDYLFNLAKRIKPDGNNIEWIEILNKLSKIDKYEKIDDSSLDNLKVKILSK